MESPQKEYAEFLLEAFEKYLKVYLLESHEPKTELLTYDFDFFKNRKWRGFGYQMIESDLVEVTNLMNNWSNLLSRWNAWNIILEDYKTDEMQIWDIEEEFVNLIIHRCLFKPSSIKDTILSIGIENFHQVRLSLDNQYTDCLPYDPKLPSFKKVFASRSKKENFLADIVVIWEGSNLMNYLKLLDGNDYRELTKNFRNLSSHGIAPRITRGEVSAVTRSISQRTQMIVGDNGTAIEAEVPNETGVSYGFGGISPLDRHELFQANLDEFNKARECYVAFRKLLEDTVTKIPLRDD